MPPISDSELNIEGIQKLLQEEEINMQNLFKKVLNFYVSNDAVRKTDDEKLDLLKKAIDESLK